MTDGPSNWCTPAVGFRGAEFDASCRVPLLALFGGAVFWLVVSSAFALIASVTFHSPDFLADCSWLTYGRVQAAAGNAQLYGFALPAGFGVALWILGRGGRRVSQPWLIAVGGKLWHLGVLVGVIAILAGDSTGFESLEMPRYAAVMLFLAYLMIGLWTMLTLQHRRDGRLSPPQGFLLAAGLWFPWIYSTANLLLLVFPVRGVEQSVIGWWYSGNLTVVWLSLVGLAAIFYFLNRDVGPAPGSFDTEWGAQGDPEPGRDALSTLRSSSATEDGPRVPAGQPLGAAGFRGGDYRPLFVFWTLILFGSWAGIPGSAPVPAWIPTLSTVATVLTTVPLLMVAVMLRQGRDARLRVQAEQPVLRSSTAEGGQLGPTGGGSALRFIRFGVGAWLVAAAMRIVAALPAASPFTNFTWFTVAQSQLNVQGFFAMTMFGGIYFIGPRVAGLEWPMPKAVRWHFWCAAAGIVLSVLPLAIGGVIQGIQLNHPEIAFMDLTRATLPFLRVSTVGDALMLLGHILLAANLVRIAIRYGRTHFLPRYAWAVNEPKPAEVSA